MAVHSLCKVEFFYDIVCPYAYLAHTQIASLCERTGAELVWCPVLLGGLFRAIGAADGPMARMPRAKAALQARDMRRWADHLGMELNQPSGHPNRTVLALRAILASGDIVRASRALFRSYWVDAADVSQREVVALALSRAGFDGEALVISADQPSVKEELHDRTERAAAMGLFGVPTFRVKTPGIGVEDGVDGELFWGQDRLLFVEQALVDHPANDAHE